MQKGLSWEVNSYSVDQEIIRFLIKSEGSLPSSQKLTTGPCSEPDEYNQRHQILFL
jgi:hypothetical protein